MANTRGQQVFKYIGFALPWKTGQFSWPMGEQDCLSLSVGGPVFKANQQPCFTDVILSHTAKAAKYQDQ